MIKNISTMVELDTVSSQDTPVDQNGGIFETGNIVLTGQGDIGKLQIEFKAQSNDVSNPITGDIDLYILKSADGGSIFENIENSYPITSLNGAPISPDFNIDVATINIDSEGVIKFAVKNNDQTYAAVIGLRYTKITFSQS